MSATTGTSSYMLSRSQHATRDVHCHMWTRGTLWLRGKCCMDARMMDLRCDTQANPYRIRSLGRVNALNIAVYVLASRDKADIVKEACRSTGWALKHASEKMRDNPEAPYVGTLLATTSFLYKAL
eukprot:3827480-Amphidinium_carterae.1